MFNPAQIEEAVLKVARLIPDEVGQSPEQAKAHIKAALTTALQKMDLVSREEFDVQAAVLAKTRLKLEALEKKVSELEAHLPVEQNKSGD